MMYHTLSAKCVVYDATLESLEKGMTALQKYIRRKKPTIEWHAKFRRRL
jgi:hypothetical protein